MKAEFQGADIPDLEVAQGPGTVSTAANEARMQQGATMTGGALLERTLQRGLRNAKGVKVRWNAASAILRSLENPLVGKFWVCVSPLV